MNCIDFLLKNEKIFNQLLLLIDINIKQDYLNKIRYESIIVDYKNNLLEIIKNCNVKPSQVLDFPTI